MVVSKYNSEIYDQLGEVSLIAKTVNEKQILGLGKIIVEHGYNNDVMAVLAHKHFKLADNEVMLETVVGDARISKPVDFQMIDKFGAYPNLISCNGKNVWYPVGFDSESKTMPLAFEDAAFLQAVSTYLLENGLQDKLLLSSRSSDMKNDVLYVERNYHDTRTSEVKEGKAEEYLAAVKTTFGFTNDHNGKIIASTACVCVACSGFFQY